MSDEQTATYKTKKAILDYLRESGWIATRSTLHRHCSEGKLLPDKITGEYLQKAVNKYAKAHLKRRETGKKANAEIDRLQEKKAKLEVEKLEEELEKIRRKRETEEGKYIARDLFELELCGRAAVLDAGLTHMIQSQAGWWIAIAGGDDRKLPDVIRAIVASKDVLMNEYARNREFTVEFETGGEIEDEE